MKSFLMLLSKMMVFDQETKENVRQMVPFITLKLIAWYTIHQVYNSALSIEEIDVWKAQGMMRGGWRLDHVKGDDHKINEPLDRTKHFDLKGG